MGDKIKTHSTIVPENIFSEVNEENQFPTLDETGFIVTREESQDNNIPQGPWLLLVDDAWRRTDWPMNELVRNYISFILSRYVLQIDLYEKLVAFNYIQYFILGKQIDYDLMQEIADICFQYVSFVPRRSLSRRDFRSLKYSTELGRSLYDQLVENHEGEDNVFSSAHREMSKNYDMAVSVMRKLDLPMQNVEISVGPVNIPDNLDSENLEQLMKIYTEPYAGNS
ncbi:hypothetical protein KC851_01250 [Candidatus Kaiserbacteria bacterium]|nr:hypothetical protein [Candidatus Kaiserbacteria bacterium]